MFKSALMLCLLTLLPVSAIGAMQAEQYLALANKVRNPQESFKVTSTLIEYKDGHETARNQLSVYSRFEGADQPYRSLIRFNEPRRDQGKLLLKDGPDLWFYDPSGKASIRISPQQRLLGQASNGDIVTTNLQVDYQATLLAEQQIKDAEGQLRDCVVLQLDARRPDVTYARIELWLDANNGQSIKSEHFAQSGAKLKTAWFRRHQTFLDQQRPSETIIIDALNPKLVTVIRSEQYQRTDVPAQWLQRQSLTSFTGQ